MLLYVGDIGGMSLNDLLIMSRCRCGGHFLVRRTLECPKNFEQQTDCRSLLREEGEENVKHGWIEKDA